MDNEDWCFFVENHIHEIRMSSSIKAKLINERPLPLYYLTTQSLAKIFGKHGNMATDKASRRNDSFEEFHIAYCHHLINSQSIAHINERRTRETKCSKRTDRVIDKLNLLHSSLTSKLVLKPTASSRIREDLRGLRRTARQWKNLKRGRTTSKSTWCIESIMLLKVVMIGRLSN